MFKYSKRKDFAVIAIVLVSSLLPCFMTYVKPSEPMLINALVVPYFLIGVCVSIACILIKSIKQFLLERLSSFIGMLIYAIIFASDYALFVSNSQNNYDGLLEPNPFYNYWLTSARFVNSASISIGYISEFIFGFTTSLFIFALVKALLEKRVKDFIKLKLRDMLWPVLPILTIGLDTLLIRVKIILSDIFSSYRPKYELMTNDSIPFWLKLFNQDTISSMFYIIAVTLILAFFLTLVKIKKSVAIVAILLCIFSVLRQFLFLLGENQLVYILSKGSEVSGIMSSAFLCISIKTLAVKTKLKV